jgi:hypothetical protein
MVGPLSPSEFRRLSLADAFIGVDLVKDWEPLPTVIASIGYAA